MSNFEDYKNKRVEFHILQSFPVTCLNRDDVGAPKTAVVGGSTRARVSSQCWKRQVRLAMRDFGAVLGDRTKLLSQLIFNKCVELGSNDELAKNCAEKIADLFGVEKKKDEEKDKLSNTDTLLFLSPMEIDLICDVLKNANFNFDKAVFLDDKNKEVKLSSLSALEKLLNSKLIKELSALDIALFGRMVAKAPSMNVEAAASFSHSISTHRVANEVEFFTAIDDVKEEQGSGHMGSLEFNSATYYRYISLDLGQLVKNMGSDEFLEKAIASFIKALFVAVPTARQTTQSGASLWDYAKVLVRKGQRIQIPFETAVKADNGGFLEPSKKLLKEELDKKEKLSGSLFGKIANFEFGEDVNFNVDNLIDSVVKSIKA